MFGLPRVVIGWPLVCDCVKVAQSVQGSRKFSLRGSNSDVFVF